MATRSYIFIALSKKDFGKEVQFDKNLHKVAEFNHQPPVVKIENKKYMGIYHHWDGYPSGVGLTLINEYKDREKIINLLSGGDASIIIDNVIQYHSWRNENWEHVKPKFVDKIIDDEDYLYLFKNGKWYFKSWNSKLTDLEEYLKNDEE